jgi:hypothetical protein
MAHHGNEAQRHARGSPTRGAAERSEAERLYRDETYLLKRKAPFKDEKLKKI